MYELGPLRPGTMADDQIELEECGIVCTSSVSERCQRCALSVYVNQVYARDQTLRVPSSPELIAPDPSGNADTE